jgi:hypothetical protein
MYESVGLEERFQSFFLQICESAGLEIIPKTFLMMLREQQTRDLPDGRQGEAINVVLFVHMHA